jgi:hypothetical protein
MPTSWFVAYKIDFIGIKLVSYKPELVFVGFNYFWCLAFFNNVIMIPNDMHILQIGWNQELNMAGNGKPTN